MHHPHTPPLPLRLRLHLLLYLLLNLLLNLLLLSLLLLLLLLLLPLVLPLLLRLLLSVLLSSLLPLLLPCYCLFDCPGHGAAVTVRAGKARVPRPLLLSLLLPYYCLFNCPGQVMALLLECELEKRGCLIEKDGTHYHIHDTVPSSAVASLESSGPADQDEFDRGRGAGIRRREAGGLVCGASIAGTMGTDGGVKEEQFAGTRLHNGTGRSSSSGDVTASRPPSGTSVWQIVAPHPDRAAKDTHRRISASASFHGAGAQHLGAPPSHHGRGRPGSAQPGSVSSRSAFW